jgi:YHS domain-containing protein
MRSTLLLWGFLLVAVSAHAGDAIAIDGLDPVFLCRGERVPGVASRTTAQFMHTYAFAHDSTLAIFRMDPERYAAQLGGGCPTKGALSPERGDPEIWTVHKGYIYFFTSTAAREAFLASPASYLEGPDEPVDPSSGDADLAASTLARVVEHMCGGERLRSLDMVLTVIRYDYEFSGTRGSYVRMIDVTPPSSAVVIDEIDGHAVGWKLDEGQGIMTMSKEVRVPADVEDAMRRELHRQPLALLRAWVDGRVIATATKTDTATLVAISVDGATSTLEIGEDQTIRAIRYHGLGPHGRALLERRYSNYRRVEGVLMPWSIVSAVDGDVVKNPTATVIEIEVR